MIKKQDATNGTRKMLAVAVRQVFKKWNRPQVWPGQARAYVEKNLHTYIGYIKHSQLLCSQLRIFYLNSLKIFDRNSIGPNFSFFVQEVYGLMLVS